MNKNRVFKGILKCAGGVTLGLLGLTTAVASADLSYYSITKGVFYHQEAGNAPILRSYNPWFFDEQMVFHDAKGAFIQVNVAPPGTFFGSPLFPPFFDNITRKTNQSVLDAAIANGYYTFSFSIGAPPAKTVSNLLAAGVFPPAPNVANLTDAQAIDPASDFSLGWNTFAGGTTNDLIVCSLQTSTGMVIQTSFVPGASNALNGTATSVLIPAGTLAPGHAYFGRLVFSTVQALYTNQYPGAVGMTLYSSQTDFYVKTTGSGDIDPPFVVSTVPANNTTDVPTNTPLVITFNEPMKHNSQITWTGTGSTKAVWSADSTQFALAPVIDFSASKTQTVVLNPLPIMEYADQNGNLLPPDAVINFTTGTGYRQPLAPAIIAPQSNSGTFQAQLLGETNAGYVFQFSTNLVNWTPFMTNTAFDGVIDFMDTNAVSSARFYRAIAY